MSSDIVKSLENIENKVFLVTGGAAGIGAGIVRALLLENARYVAFLDIAEKEGSHLEKELLGMFGALRAKFIKCDITDETQLNAAYEQVFEKYRRLDVVINNAGVLAADDNDYKRIVDVNLTATISSTLKAISHMGVDKGGMGGTVINVSSLLAFNAKPHLPVYKSTKIAVLQFSNSIGSEQFYSKTKVRVVTVCLGPTDTAILQKPNLQKFDKDHSQSLTSRAKDRQSVQSAVHGMLQVINNGTSGSTWMVADGKPPVDISKNIVEGFTAMLSGINKND
ncbi:unnamed protein product [Chilo suppressalis]|uniref:15-hydroxyprostaglandin dehydrogenase [NAD(+)]-like n=1 Tax=Chilo suppressalis TaxID=168631 RepID=A0ABN8BA37_CHISP|nr:unnamed protein product [Chilo suppressalis]